MAQTLDWHQLERASQLLADMPATARRGTRRIELDQRSYLFAIGDRPTAMYFVLAGEVRLVRPSAIGSDVILQRTRQGFVAEASLDHSAYHCDAIAVESATLLAIPRKLFVEALAHEDFRKGWMAHLASELRRVRAQAERLGLKTARERIVHYIETEGHNGALTLTQSKKDWALELGLTHEALYRTLRSMQQSRDITVVADTLRIGLGRKS